MTWWVPVVVKYCDLQARKLVSLWVGKFQDEAC